jgi:hypothetical protein
MEQRMGASNRMTKLIASIRLMPDIFKFINTSYITVNDEKYLKSLTKFKTDVREFIQKGLQHFSDR